MNSLKELFRIGPGPSSSHTMGPPTRLLRNAAACSFSRSFLCYLIWIACLNWKRPLSDVIIQKTFAPKPCQIIMNTTDTMPHPNTLKLCAYDADNNLLKEMIVYSIGGGAIVIKGEEAKKEIISTLITH